jgi:hypothetical protein
MIINLFKLIRHLYRIHRQRVFLKNYYGRSLYYRMSNLLEVLEKAGVFKEKDKRLELLGLYRHKINKKTDEYIKRYGNFHDED